MGICWYCHWGWAKEVVAVWNWALSELGDELILQYGPAHVVWGDENFETDIVAGCLNDALVGKGWHDGEGEESVRVKHIVVTSLRKLLAIPESIRCCCPADYDGEHPERYPPSVEVARPS